jgi:ABC-type branched-subunit amino acid transport system ATPase component
MGLVVMLLALYEPKGLIGLVQRLRPRPSPRPEGSADGGTQFALRNEDPPLTVTGLRKHFGGVVALDDISLTVRPGEILGLLGPNGAGKSTLFDCITGFQRPLRGTVHLGSESLTYAPAHVIAQRGVVRTFQLIRIFPDLTVWQNLLVAQPHRGESIWQALQVSAARTEQRAETYLRIIGLTTFRHTPAAQLSYGQQKLLSLAMGLMSDAAILFLDEPTAGVNPKTIDGLIGVIRDANRAGQTFVIIEHNTTVIDALAHRVYFMADGRMLAEGTPADLRENALVLEAYYGR